MLKPKKLNLEDTNISALGSDLHHKVALEAANSEAAWKNAGKAVGIEVFRIEKFNVKKWSQVGTFYDGDSYIVLRTYKKTPESQALSFDVHFWLGLYTTQDEAGTAAYKTVELDEVLGGAPVQHREVQGNESQLFLSYFPFVSILSGGVDSGFNKVSPETHSPRLLQIRKVSAKTTTVTQVELGAGSLNSGDVFVLDAGLVLYQWNGAVCSPGEKSSAAALCRAIDDERKGLPKVVVVEEADDDAAFWAALGGKGPVKSAEAGSKAAAEAANKPTEKRLLRISDASGSLAITQVASGADVKKALLASEDVFVLDAGFEVFVWIGKGTSPAEKSKGFTFATEFLKKEGRNPALPVTKVIEGNENETFHSLLH